MEGFAVVLSHLRKDRFDKRGVIPPLASRCFENSSARSAYGPSVEQIRLIRVAHIYTYYLKIYMVCSIDQVELQLMKGKCNVVVWEDFGLTAYTNVSSYFVVRFVAVCL